MLSRRTFGALLAMAATAGVAACSNNSPATPSGSASPTAEASSSAPATEASFPITIKHAFGETTIEKMPERIATVAWANHEVPLALGIVPVGMSKATWGDEDGDGLLPWVKAKLEELGAPTPVLFDETDSIPFEAVDETQPDLILAAYSGISQEDYDTLSKIAPVIAFPKVAWGTTMNEMIQLNSEAMGMKDKGDALVADLAAQVKATAEKHPELKGKKAAWAAFNADDLSKVSIYTGHDPRASFLLEAGLASPGVVEEQTKASESFFVELSSEQPELFDDVDFFLLYGSDDNAPLVAAMQAHPLVGRIKAVAENRLVFLGNGALAASANPSPLSIPAMLDQYFAKMAEGVK
ncbi:MAG: iron-siderophore ABC transporter substrate-binding protein [Propionibacteriaceae bacterium]|nr:iron-siderophore ABC transporter substrate-binding protein [Propionibacteriaceae bacterium]